MVHGGSGSRHSRRILVVDDDEDSATILVLLLEKCGHEVHTCSRGREALEASTRVRPDLAIIDLRLGDMSGFEVARALREREETCDTALVALSGLDGADVGERCRAAGFDSHVLKPIRDFESFRELIGSLETQTGRSRS